MLADLGCSLTVGERLQRGRTSVFCLLNVSFSCIETQILQMI